VAPPALLDRALGRDYRRQPPQATSLRSSRNLTLRACAKYETRYLRGELVYELVYVGLTAGLVVGLFGGRSETAAQAQRGNSQLGKYLTRAVKGLAFVLAIALIYQLATGQGALVFGLLFGLPVLFASVLIGGPSIRPRSIAVVETVGWSPEGALNSGLAFGLVFGLVTGLLFWLTSGLISGLGVPGLVFGLFSGLVLGLGAGLVVGLLGGLASGGTVERAVPNQGIHRSARLAVVFGLVAGLVFGLGSVLVHGLLNWLFFGPLPWQSARIVVVFVLAHGLSAGPFFGLGTGLSYGGQACLSHLALRFVLWREGVMPLNYVGFLDYATERIFLRRVGGGYIFIHRLIQEHFAANEEALVERVARIPNLTQ
jgi:hypothetical protein